MTTPEGVVTREAIGGPSPLQTLLRGGCYHCYRTKFTSVVGVDAINGSLCLSCDVDVTYSYVATILPNYLSMK